MLGEDHDDADHHGWQLQTLAALHVLRPDMVIGFEAFPRRVQPVLDRWVAGELNAQQFLAAVEWEKVWSFAPELYLPLFEFARINRIPMVALNVERSLTAAVRKGGWDAVPADRREGVSKPAAAAPDYAEYLFEVFRQHAPKGVTPSRSDAGFRFFVEAQTTWDRAFAEALASHARNDARPLAVGIVGSGHIRHGHGVAHQLRNLGVTRVASLVPVSARADCVAFRQGYADALFALPPAAAKEDTRPRLGVSLEAGEGFVTVSAVNPGSLAESSGLRPGDRVVSIAGSPPASAAAVANRVRSAPPGTWLPLGVRRGETTLELIVKFPPER